MEAYIFYLLANNLENEDAAPELNDETEPRSQMGFHSQAPTATVQNSSCKTASWYAHQWQKRLHFPLATTNMDVNLNN